MSLLETPCLNRNGLRTTLHVYLGIKLFAVRSYTLRTFEKFAGKVTNLLPATISTNNPLPNLLLNITCLEGHFDIKNLIDYAHYDLYMDSPVKGIRMIQRVERLFSRLFFALLSGINFTFILLVEE